MKSLSTSFLKSVTLASFVAISLTSYSVQAAAVACKSAYDVEAPAALAKDITSFDAARFTRQSDPKKADAILLDTVHRLMTEKVVAAKNLGGGVNTSYVFTFSSGIRAVFKPVNPQRPNQPIREAIAFRISMLFGLDIVPPTIVRNFKSSEIPKGFTAGEGSLQLFVETARPLVKGHDAAGAKNLLLDGKPFDPDTTVSGRRLRLFDWLINNHDRGTNAGNYMISKLDQTLLGVDHGVSFVGHDKTADPGKVPYYKKEFLADKEFYQKLTSRSRAEISAALKGLNPVRVEEFLQRHDKLTTDFSRHGSR